ncbi:hypothetical protein ACMHYB_35805 [Sorangium sp. So ce1128]
MVLGDEGAHQVLGAPPGEVAQGDVGISHAGRSWQIAYQEFERQKSGESGVWRALAKVAAPWRVAASRTAGLGQPRRRLA